MEGLMGGTIQWLQQAQAENQEDGECERGTHGPSLAPQGKDMVKMDGAELSSKSETPERFLKNSDEFVHFGIPDDCPE